MTGSHRGALWAAAGPFSRLLRYSHTKSIYLTIKSDLLISKNLSWNFLAIWFFLSDERLWRWPDDCRVRGTAISSVFRRISAAGWSHPSASCVPLLRVRVSPINVKWIFQVFFKIYKIQFFLFWTNEGRGNRRGEGPRLDLRSRLRGVVGCRAFLRLFEYCRQLFGQRRRLSRNIAFRRGAVQACKIGMRHRQCDLLIKYLRFFSDIVYFLFFKNNLEVN